MMRMREKYPMGYRNTLNCPKCGSTRYTGGPPVVKGIDGYQDLVCSDCDHHWRQQFDFEFNIFAM